MYYASIYLSICPSDPYSSLALLCPLSSYGPVVPLQTSVITIGAGTLSKPLL